MSRTKNLSTEEIVRVTDRDENVTAWVQETYPDGRRWVGYCEGERPGSRNYSHEIEEMETGGGKFYRLNALWHDGISDQRHHMLDCHTLEAAMR